MVHADPPRVAFIHYAQMRTQIGNYSGASSLCLNSKYAYMLTITRLICKNFKNNLFLAPNPYFSSPAPLFMHAVIVHPMFFSHRSPFIADFTPVTLHSSLFLFRQQWLPLFPFSLFSAVDNNDFPFFQPNSGVTVCPPFHCLFSVPRSGDLESNSYAIEFCFGSKNSERP